MENCDITIEDEDGEYAVIPAREMPRIKYLLAHGCTVVRIHRPGHCMLPR